ncbi:MAG: cyclic nucleotide-binding domain-containing protein [Polyangiaceae bacterium]|nr:cyclic nucleotide-binding domain-containing protein [Polyangiaceae bacterium]
MSFLLAHLPLPLATDPEGVIAALQAADAHARHGKDEHAIAWVERAASLARQHGFHQRAAEIEEPLHHLEQREALSASSPSVGVVTTPPRTQTSSLRPSFSAPRAESLEFDDLDIDVEFDEPEDDFGEAELVSETDLSSFAPQDRELNQSQPQSPSRRPIDSRPDARDVEPIDVPLNGPVLDFDATTAAEFANSVAAPISDQDSSALEEELGVDLSIDLRAPGVPRGFGVPSSQPVSPSLPSESAGPKTERMGQHETQAGSLAAPTSEQTAITELAPPQAEDFWQDLNDELTADEGPEGIRLAQPPSIAPGPGQVVGRASVAPAAPPSGGYRAVEGQPFDLAPSADPPATRTHRPPGVQGRAAIEPPPTPAPTPQSDQMREPPPSIAPQAPLPEWGDSEFPLPGTVSSRATLPDDLSIAPISLGGPPLPQPAEVPFPEAQGEALPFAEARVDEEELKHDSLLPLSFPDGVGAGDSAPPTLGELEAPVPPLPQVESLPEAIEPSAPVSSPEGTVVARAVVDSGEGAQAIPDLDFTSVTDSNAPAAPEDAHSLNATASEQKPAEEAKIGPYALADLPGLEDLPEDGQALAASRAKELCLELGEEASDFALALVLAGRIQVMPLIADAGCSTAGPGEVLFFEGTMSDSFALRTVAVEPGTRVATLSFDDWKNLTQNCPWVVDELRHAGDRLQTFAGAVLGPLGDYLDDTFRSMVFEKCQARRLSPQQQIAVQGQPTDGFYILGSGELEVFGDAQQGSEVLDPGDFLFPENVLSGAVAAKNARAGQQGALVLFIDRMAVHELLATCPPLIELLAS